MWSNEDQNCKPKVQYGLTVAEDFLRSLSGIGATTNVFMPGDYIPVEDEALGVKHSVRVQSFTRDLLRPYSYSLTLSDTTTTSILNRIISDQIETDKIIRMNNIKDPATARANWRRSREVMAAVFDPEGNYYTAKIRPQSIDTVALSVGAKSMQFGLTNTVFEPNYGGNANVIRVQGGVLTHYTIDESKARSWTLADGQATLDDASSPYYVYAKCQRAGAGGVIIFTKEQIRVDQDPAYYHFWIGILNSVDKEKKARAFAPMYGFTMINGRFIKTGRIQSADGETYFDLDAGEIGGNIKIKGNSDYATKTELKVLSDQIHGEVGQINTKLGGTQQQLESLQTWSQGQVNSILNRQNTAEDKIYRLQTAGFLTTAQGNALYASAELADGTKIASYITQSPTAINMISRNINIDASVTFGNFKEDNAQKLAAVNRRVGNAETAISQQNQAINEAKNGTVDLNRVRYGNRTIIDRGKIITSLIDTDNLKVREAASIGGFRIVNTALYGTRAGCSTCIDTAGWISLSSQNGTTTRFIDGAFEIFNGSGSIGFKIARIPGDPDWHSYVQCQLRGLPHKNHIAAGGGANFKNVVIDINSGLLGWE